MTTAEGTACRHVGLSGTCDEVARRAKTWTGPDGLTASDLRYSVVMTIERHFRIGMHWPRPDALPGVTWAFSRRESCGTDDGFVAWVYGAAMDLEAFSSLVEGFTSDGESGGLIGPPEAEKWWAPSVVYVSDYNERLTVTAWPKRRAIDEHLFDEWEAVCELLIGEPAYSPAATITQT
jgi:hypothetical protein